jgi:hypothetical protein
MKSRVHLYQMAIVASLVVQLSGCIEAESNDQSFDRNKLAENALVISKAESVAMATSALRSIDSGDLVVARSTLTAHIKSGLVVLKTVRTGKEGDQAVMIDESIRDAETYLTENGEAVPSIPAPTKN